MTRPEHCPGDAVTLYPTSAQAGRDGTQLQQSFAWTNRRQRGDEPIARMIITFWVNMTR